MKKRRIQVEVDLPPDQELSEELKRYRKRLRIDRDDLDTALLQQAELYRKVADQYVDAVARRDQLKLDLKYATSKASARVRRSLSGSKPRATEGQIGEIVATDDKIKELEKRRLDAHTEAEHWLALKEGFQQRSYVLKELVALYLQRVYATTSVSVATNDFADSNRARAGMMRRRGR